VIALERILCAIDLGPTSHSALKCAVGIAARFGAELYTVHVRAENQRVGPWFFWSRADEVERLMADHNLARELETIVDDARTVATTRVSHGVPSTAILDYSRECASDLIVLGQSASALRGRLSGDLATKAACAVLTVPDTIASPMERILLPVDFSSATPIAEEWAILLARRCASSVHVIHALPSKPREAARETHQRVTKATLRLQALETRLRRAGVRADSALVQNNTIDAILARRESEDCDLVVLGVHEQGLSERHTRARTVSAVRSQSAVPVLTIRAHPRDVPLMTLASMDFDAAARSGPAALVAASA